MAHRSKAPIRHERQSDTMDALKPLIVLGLLGTILYGAYSVVQKGPGNSGPAWQLPGVTSQAGMATDAPPFSPPPAPAVEMPAPVASQQAAPPAAAAPPIAELPAAQAAAFPPPPVASAAPAPLAGPPAFSPPPQAQAAAEPPAAFAAAPAVVAAAPAAGGTLPDQPPTFLNAQSASPPVPETAAASISPPAAAPPASPIEPPAAFAANAAGAATPTAPAALGTQAPAAPAALAAAPAALGAAAATGAAAFATAWTEAHDKLAAARYAEALAALSAWHDDPSLSIEESQRLQDLLGQLAGTVIYSQQDLLLPPHIVAPGETLQAIAAPLAVPWQLLAKINGIDDPARLIPGEHLKVIRGPFDAVVSVSRRQLSLQVAGNYAGSFPVVIGRQIQDRVGASLAVVTIRRGVAEAPSSAPTSPAAQVAYVSGAATKSIALGDGLSIEAAEDPGLIVDSAPQSSLVVSARDLEELIDILGPGSHVLVRQ